MELLVDWMSFHNEALSTWSEKAKQKFTAALIKWGRYTADHFLALEDMVTRLELPGIRKENLTSINPSNKLTAAIL